MTDVLDRALKQLEAGPITLVGAPAAGTTTVGMQLLERLGMPTIVLRIHGATETSDLLRDLGAQAGAGLPGDPASVGFALSKTPHAILLDDADLAPDPALQVLGTGPDCRWIATGRTRVIGETVDVPMGEFDRPWLDVDAIPPGLELLAELPMGSPHADAATLDVWRLPDISHRVVLRRSVREALGADATPSAETCGAVLRDRIDDLHRLACDLGPHAIEDLPLYRLAARIVNDDTLAVLAGTAAARMHLRSFQASEALDVVRGVRLRAALRPGTLGLLAWVEGDALLIRGDEEGARKAHEEAAEQLMRAGATRARIALARRCANRWAARNAVERAHNWLRMAREDLARRPDPEAMADILRISADLAAGAGELVGARALYEEAEVVLDDVEGGAAHTRTAIRVGRMGLAIAGGDLGLAETLLDDTGPINPPPAIAWRRAELATRLSRYREAHELLKMARQGFRATGSAHGLMLCARAQGDLAALQGDRSDAVEQWRDAVTLCVRSRDLRGLRRVLERLWTVENEGAQGPWLIELREHRDLADTLIELADGRTNG